MRERDPPTGPEMRAGMKHNTAATAALGRAAEGRRYGRWALCWQPPGYASRQPLARGEHHDHLAAFEFRLLLDLGHRREVAADALEQFGAELLVGELSASEAQGDLDLVAFLEEPPDRAHLHVIVVIVDHRPELDLLDLDDLLLFARLGGLLLLLVLEFAVVEDFADRGGLVGDDLDEVQPRFGGDGERVADLNGAVVLAWLSDQLHLANANLIVDARAVLLNGQRGFHRATNGEDLLCLLRRAVSRIPARMRAPASSTTWPGEDREKRRRSQRRSGHDAKTCPTALRGPRRQAQMRRIPQKARASRIVFEQPRIDGQNRGNDLTGRKQQRGGPGCDRHARAPARTPGRGRAPALHRRSRGRAALRTVRWLWWRIVPPRLRAYEWCRSAPWPRVPRARSAKARHRNSRVLPVAC